MLRGRGGEGGAGCAGALIMAINKETQLINVPRRYLKTVFNKPVIFWTNTIEINRN